MPARDDLPKETWTVIKVDWGYSLGTDYPYSRYVVLDNMGDWCDCQTEDIYQLSGTEPFTFEIISTPVNREAAE